MIEPRLATAAEIQEPPQPPPPHPIVLAVAKAMAPYAWRDSYWTSRRGQTVVQEIVITRAKTAIGAFLHEAKAPPFDPEDVSYHTGMTRLDWWRAMLEKLREQLRHRQRGDGAANSRSHENG